MKRITDKDFKYTPSHSTDIRKTFERLARQKKAKEEAAKKIAEEQARKLVRMAR